MSLLSTLGQAAAELLASAVAPPRCAACDERVPMLVAFCEDCIATIERAPGAKGPSVAAFAYGGAIAEAITRLKYDGRPDLGRPLGDLLARAVVERVRPGAGTVVVPVPLHPTRLAERGYNQSALLARRVVRLCRLPWLPLALARTRNTPPQAALDREGRGPNVMDAFRVRPPMRVRGKGILLVDDVRTTGATLDACSRALLTAGAKTVAHAVVAQAQAGV